MSIVAVVWDFDGVILNSLLSLYYGICAVLTADGKKLPSVSEFLRFYDGPFYKYFEKNGVKFAPEEIQRLYNEARASDMDRLRVFPSFLPVFHSLREAGRRQYILSAEPNCTYLTRHLDRHGLMDLFHGVYCGHDDKVGRLRAIATEVGCRFDEVAFVGDLRPDMRDGRTAKVVAVGFDPLHYDTEEALRGAGADHYFRSHEDVRKFVLGPGS